MHISQKDAVCPKRCEGRMGGVLRGNGDRAAILPRSDEGATASGYDAGGPGGGSASVCRTARQQAASKARGCRQLRERGAADGRERAEERGRLQELKVADGYGNGEIADGCESTGPRAATKAWGHGRPRKRGATDGRGVRKLRAAMGCPIMSAEGAGKQGWEWLRRAGCAGDLASMLTARRLPGPSAHNVTRKR